MTNHAYLTNSTCVSSILSNIFSCARYFDSKRATHKHRLLKFGAELVFTLCEIHQVEVVIINQGEDLSFEEDLAKDVLEIITVFAARLYGAQSQKNKKFIETAKVLLDDTD